MTEYDLPRPTIEPHDVIADSDGMVWFSNFGKMFFPLELDQDLPVGSHSLRLSIRRRDRDKRQNSISREIIRSPAEDRRRSS